MQNFQESSSSSIVQSSQHPKNPDFSKVRANKYFHEIGAEMLGNQLIIRMEKDKKRKKESQWDPICDCDMVEIKRPTKNEGPKIVNAGDNNQILFRIHSKNHLNVKDDPNYKPQAIAYKIGPENGGKDGSSNCRTITVHPQLGGVGTQEVFNDHVTEGNQDIFLLRIKKKDGAPNQAKRNIEVELRTPKPPTPPPPSPKESVSPIVEKPPTVEEPKKGEKSKKKKGGKQKKSGKKKK